MSPQMTTVTEESNTINYTFWTLNLPRKYFAVIDYYTNQRLIKKKITQEFLCKLGLCEMMFFHSWRALLLIVFLRLVLK